MSNPHIESDPQLSPWVDGCWNGLEPVIPDDFPEFVWLAIYFPWKRGHADPVPFEAHSVVTNLRSVAYYGKAKAERDGLPIPAPPRWAWMPLARPISPCMENT